MLRTIFIAIAALALSLPAAASGFYVTAFGGADMRNDFGGVGPKASFATTPDTGYVAGLALGSHIAALPGARAELEFSWRNASHAGAYDACEDGPLDGEDSTFAALFNAAYDFDMGEFRPYVLAGAGYGARRISISPTPSNWELNGNGADEQGFAWQMGVGVAYTVSDEISIGLGYRYFVGPTIDRVADFGHKRTFMEADGDSHSVIATVTVALE